MRPSRRNISPQRTARVILCAGALALCSISAWGQTTIGQETAVITSDTTWGVQGSPYTLTRDVEVRSQATLTIEPGVEVRFAPSDAASTNNPSGVEILVRGSLQVDGTLLDPVVFTGQDLATPAEHATGVIFAAEARGSELHHLQISGLAHGVKQLGDMSLVVDGLSVSGSQVAFQRTTGGSDLILNQVSLQGSLYALDLAALGEGVFIRVQQSELDGHVHVSAADAGVAGFSSELTLSESSLQGDLVVEGNLQANSQLNIHDSAIERGGVFIQGDVNTSASVSIDGDTTIDAINGGAALHIQGVILADATVSIEDSMLNGDVRLGPTPDIGGAGEGQYFLTSTPATWSDAAADCEARGGKLADVNNLDESRAVFSAARGGDTGLAWMGGTLVPPSCEAGATYTEVQDFNACNTLRNDEFPVRSITEGYRCACSENCALRSETLNSCFTYNFTCFSSVSYEARLPECDTRAAEGQGCLSPELSWLWESGEALDQNAAPWGQGVADELTCLGESPNLQESLHIAVDTTDPTGGQDGSLGLWRARAGSSMYSYVCEGRLGAPSTQDASRGTVTITDSHISGHLAASVGQLSIFGSHVGMSAQLSLYRSGSIIRNTFLGTVNVASRSTVEVSANSVTLTTAANGMSAGGGVLVESEHAVIYGNKIDGGSYGVVVRGTAEVANNLITRISDVGVHLMPATTEAGEETMIVNNTLVDAYHGVKIEGLVDAPATHLYNNNIYRGAGIAVHRVASAPVLTSHNNVFAYDTLYSGLSPDAQSVSANPGFVADFPAAEPIFRLDSGSPLIDLGSCDLAPIAPVSEGGLRIDIDGIPRPFDGDFDRTPGCDIGAYEFGPEEIFIYVDGAPANSQSFATGREVELTVWGRRDANIFPVTPVVWTILERVGQLNEDTDQFRPDVTPGFIEDAIHAQFGNLTTSLDVDLACGCPAPDRADGSPGECNDVPDGYFDDWDEPIRENYCLPVQAGSFEAPLTVAAEDMEQIRAGARDTYGFVFKHDQPFTYNIVGGGGSVTPTGMFTASPVAGDYLGSLQISSQVISNGVATPISGLTDIKIVPNDPAVIVISSAAATVQTTRTLLYTAVVRDAFGNEVPDAEVTWSVEGVGATGIDPVTGRLSAGCVPGTYPDAVVATYNGITGRATLVVEAGGAILSHLNVTPSSLTIPATTDVNFSATVTDACGYTRPVVDPVFSVNGGAGAFGVEDEGDAPGSRDHVFTASCQLGFSAGAVGVSAEGLSALVNVTVEDAPLNRMSIQPDTAQVRMRSSYEFEAIGVDECNRLKTIDNAIWTTPITNATVSEVGLATNGQRLTIDCSDIGSVAGGIRAEFTDRFNRPFTAGATVQVLPGEVFDLTIPDTQRAISLPAGNEVQLQANAYDECGNSRNDAITWSASNGTVDSSSGLYRAGCTRGSFPNAIFAQAGRKTGQISVDVTDGVLNRIEINPSPVTAQAGSELQLNAQLFDGCNNLIDRQAEWTLTEGGSITPTGRLTASEEARRYFGAVVAELDGIQDSADLIVTPAAAERLEVSPEPFVVSAGSVNEVTVTAFDRFENPFSPEVSWSVNPAVGAFNSDGDFVAGTLVGTYQSGLVARVGTATLEVDVQIVAGAVAALNVQPTPVIVRADEEIQLTVTPVDSFGNEVVGTPINWSVEAGGGLISSTGLFTASTEAGDYQDTIIASGGGVSQAVSVEVTPNDAVRLSLIPNPLTLVPQEERQIILNVFDAFDNEIEPANVVFATALGGEHFTVSPTGLVRALLSAGDGLIQVNANGLSDQVDLNVIPGVISKIEVLRPEREASQELVVVQEEIVVRPGQVVPLTAIATDEFDNAVDAQLIWSTRVDGFGITADGVFTAGPTAGTYASAIRVRHLSVERLINVVIVPGSPVALHVEPEVIVTSPNSSTQLSAYFTDAQGNITEADIDLEWRVSPGSGLELDQVGLLTLDCSVSPEFQPNVITVSTVPGSPVDLTGTADVEIRAGETERVIFEPIRYEVVANRQVALSARTQDSCGYSTPDQPRYAVESGSGAVSAEGVFTAGVIAETVTVSASFGEASATAEVIVKPGAAVSVRVIPDETEVIVGERELFEVEAEDEFGNVWSPLDAVWSVKNADGSFGDEDDPNQEGPVGLIDDQGLLRANESVQAGTYDGDFEGHVRVTVQGQDAYADVKLSPSEPDRIEVSPASVTLIPNQIQSFSATVYDEYDNLIESVEPVFEVDERAGFISESGILSATDRVDDYGDAVSAKVGNVVGKASVIIVNSEPASVVIEPASVRVHVGSIQRFTAVVYDTEGVVIEGASVMWSLDNNDIGEINNESGVGRLNVGVKPGNYYSGMVASIVTSDGVNIRGTADVIIPRDFDEDGIDDVLEYEQRLNPGDPNDADIDEDGDGLTNAQEVNVGLDYEDADTDDDGIIDGAEELWGSDTDGDGDVNAADSDSDGDGIPDGVEAGVSQPHPDTQTNLFTPDADPETVTDPLSQDSDGDGIPDGEEDRNQNGRLDPGETPANRDLNVIACDSLREDTGCPADLVCLESICTTPPPAPTPKPETSCDVDEGRNLPLFALLLALFALRRRERQVG